VFIAGSSWPGDERVIIPGLIRLLEKYDHFKVIMVPHEIKNEHINEIQKAFGDKGFGSERYSVFKEGNGTEKRIAIIDTIGLLARLYRDTHIAYVGGSFGKGVHNVLEPAVFGMPVLFGPKHHNSQEALSMKEMGITFETRDTREFTGMMEKLVNDRGFRDNCAGEALGYIRDNLGASGKIYQNLSNIFDFF
jgi:3-deoxy-D-manno-octulosonic-acid transferase